MFLLSFSFQDQPPNKQAWPPPNRHAPPGRRGNDFVFLHLFRDREGARREFGFVWSMMQSISQPLLFPRSHVWLSISTPLSLSVNASYVLWSSIYPSPLSIVTVEQKNLEYVVCERKGKNVASVLDVSSVRPKVGEGFSVLPLSRDWGCFPPSLGTHCGWKVRRFHH